jgi:hypothetical protein
MEVNSVVVIGGSAGGLQAPAGYEVMLTSANPFFDKEAFQL